MFFFNQLLIACSVGYIKKIGNNGFYGNSLSLLAPIINGENILIAFNKKIESFSLKTGKSNWTLGLNGARVWSGFSFDNKTINHELNIYQVINNKFVEVTR